MKSLEEMTLTERIKLYAEGDPKNEIHRHSFDFSQEDEESIMSALRIVWLLSRENCIHDYQHERDDIVNFCNVTNGIIRIAKNFIKNCPLRAEFRLDFKKEKNERDFVNSKRPNNHRSGGCQ